MSDKKDLVSAETIIIASIYALGNVLAQHAGKGDGWKPTPENVAALLKELDEATPEARKEAARIRLGLSSGGAIEARD